MLRRYSRRIMSRIHERFKTLYGDRADKCMERLDMAIGRYGVGMGISRPSMAPNERDVVLITYGDMVTDEGERPLTTLKTFLDRRGDHAINTVHILPFFPWSSDDGFSVIDYREVDRDLGQWKDIEALSENYTVMADLVLNHVSRKSDWFREYVMGTAPARDYFVEADPEEPDLSRVVRPRSLPLLTRTRTRDGIRHVWTTFSSDQVDLNFENPDVLFEFIDILLFFRSQGIRVIRMDAIAYLWKEIGTDCIHHPMTHEVVKLFRDLMDMILPDMILLTETNVPHEENVSYFGDGDEAHMV
ncbi:MAG: alpha-amylase family glycosyl hydrolase, partial [Verrucomicrobiota bacterium]